MKKYKQFTHPESEMSVITLVWRNWTPGTIVSEEDWNKAREIVWADAALETLLWKQNNLTIGEFQKPEPLRGLHPENIAEDDSWNPSSYLIDEEGYFYES